jgi:thioesterase domain-containing protein
MNWGAAATAGIVRWTPRRQSYAFLCLSLRMQGRYRPEPYSGSALFLLTGSWRERLAGIQNLVTGEKRRVEIPGNHRTLLREPHVTAVAALLREALAAADSLTDPLEGAVE